MVRLAGKVLFPTEAAGRFGTPEGADDITGEAIRVACRSDLGG
jgi:hypothetical protein